MLSHFHFQTRIPLQQGNSQLYTFLNPLRNKIPKLPQTKTLERFRMVAQSVSTSTSTKRPTCLTCSKPARLCLCNRFPTPTLDNPVNITILQHSLEKGHPLNSTRIVTIGLKNVDVITVSDVNFQAQYFISLLDSSCGMGLAKLDETSHLFDEMPSKGCFGSTSLENRELGDAEIIERNGFNGAEMHGICKNGSVNLDLLMDKSSNSDECMWAEKGEVIISNELKETCLEKKEVASAINFTIEKYGAISSFNNCLIPPNKSVDISFDDLLTSDKAVDDLRKGFVVKKLQKKPSGDTLEFEIAVPEGSVLLFPSENSVDVEAVKFEVKNLIVLDGTWAKAKRMYNENPWLRFLPHVRLDVDKLSLYGEVRNQPRAGYFSTIESIVYALKAVGEDNEGLDGLLDVFESMVGDQRRCQYERMIKDNEI